MKTICTMCKRANPKSCSREYCPILKKMSFERRVKFSPKKDYSGDSPNVFVGSHGYPNLNVGILSAEDYSHNDDPLYWSRKNIDIGRIVDMRSVMINSMFKANAKNLNRKFLDMGREIAMSAKPVDIEIGLKDKPKFRVAVDQDLLPQGPRVVLEKARLTENPKVPRIVEKAVSDTDWKASNALSAMYKKNIDEHSLTKLLSIGNLGMKKDRKLVPTRWSITAVDSNLSKNEVEKVKDYGFHEHAAHLGGHYGNYFLILFFPDVWSYELIETFVGNAENVASGNTNSASDSEGYGGRKKYVEETAGAYYATRLAVAEHLHKKKKQASCLVLRFITDEYTVPLGVWIVREGVRKALESKPIYFADRKLLLEYARKVTKKKFFGFNLDSLIAKSSLVQELKSQKKLGDY